jgi:putative sensory transduction regulator
VSLAPEFGWGRVSINGVRKTGAWPVNQIQRFFGAAIIILGMMGGTSVSLSAAEFVGAVAPNDILRMLKDNGYADAHIESTDYEDLPVLNLTLASSTAFIYFYECGSIGKVCEHLQLKVVVPTQNRPSFKLVNDFNAAERYSQAYFDDQDDLVIEHWLTLEGGISETNFLYSVATFARVVDKFEDLVPRR